MYDRLSPTTIALSYYFPVLDKLVKFGGINMLKNTIYERTLNMIAELIDVRPLWLVCIDINFKVRCSRLLKFGGLRIFKYNNKCTISCPSRCTDLN